MSEEKNGLTREEQKAILKEAIEEWLDKRYAQFGRFVLGAVLVTAFAALVYISIRGGQWPQQP